MFLIIRVLRSIVEESQIPAPATSAGLTLAHIQCCQPARSLAAHIICTFNRPSATLRGRLHGILYPREGHWQVAFLVVEQRAGRKIVISTPCLKLDMTPSRDQPAAFLCNKTAMEAFGASSSGSMWSRILSLPT